MTDGLAPAAELVGRRYEAVMLLGAGGMGRVYLAVWRGAAGFARLVAVKQAHTHAVNGPELRRSFVREARLAAAIRHANVVAVLDVEEQDSDVTLVLEYVEGVSLAELVVHAGRLSPALAGRIVLDVARGLHAAHETRDVQGRPLSIVHRDVSPHNVLVGRDGVARITDFGVAQVARDAWAEQGGRMQVRGKLAYMAPEYLERGACDHRADIFSLGVVAWEAFVGERLFRGERDTETIRRVLLTNTARASERARHLPRALDEILARALARDPRDRFQTCRDFAEALETVLREQKLHASPEQVSMLVEARVGHVLDARRRAARGHLERDADDPVLGRSLDEATAELSALAARPDGLSGVEPRIGRTHATGTMSVPSSVPTAPSRATGARFKLHALAGAVLIGVLCTTSVYLGGGLLAGSVPVLNRVPLNAMLMGLAQARTLAGARAPSIPPLARPTPTRFSPKTGRAARPGRASSRESVPKSAVVSDKAPPNPYRERR
ncbi:MAG TPA: serine/threonine-protein kinase [Polyangiaceae bacterium]